MVSDNTGTIDPQKCPLCGQSNYCGVKEEGADCWCRSEIFPEALLSNIPVEHARQTCICQRCVNEFASSAQESS
ncbi:MAG: cysteine-rich CWC family protein [Porticoccus sp.]